MDLENAKVEELNRLYCEEAVTYSGQEAQARSTNDECEHLAKVIIKNERCGNLWFLSAKLKWVEDWDCWEITSVFNDRMILDEQDIEALRILMLRGRN